MGTATSIFRHAVPIDHKDPVRNNAHGTVRNLTGGREHISRENADTVGHTVRKDRSTIGCTEVGIAIGTDVDGGLRGPVEVEGERKRNPGCEVCIIGASER